MRHALSTMRVSDVLPTYSFLKVKTPALDMPKSSALPRVS